MKNSVLNLLSESHEVNKISSYHLALTKLAFVPRMESGTNFSCQLNISTITYPQKLSEEQMICD